MRVDPTTLLATLDAAVQARRAPTVLKMAHEALLEHMRGTGEAPNATRSAEITLCVWGYDRIAAYTEGRRS